MDNGIKFEPYSGDLMGLPTDENHLNFIWCGPGKILFSCSRIGDAASIHFASDKAGLRYIKTAINDFVDFVFWLYDWCTMIIGKVSRDSICRLIEKIGFIEFAQSDIGRFYMRPRQ